MSADLTIIENSDVVLALEPNKFAEAHELSIILPRDKMIAVALLNEIVNDRLQRDTWSNLPYEEILATGMVYQSCSKSDIAEERVHRRIDGIASDMAIDRVHASRFGPKSEGIPSDWSERCAQ